MTYEYSGIPIDKLLDLDIYEYRILFINAFVEAVSQSEEGRKLLSEYNTYQEHNTEFDAAGMASLLNT